jgi:hypothetical protein
MSKSKCQINDKFQNLYIATSMTAKVVIPAKAGIQEETGFPRVKHGAGLIKPGMTDWIRLISPCVKFLTFKLGIPGSNGGYHGHSSGARKGQKVSL